MGIERFRGNGEKIKNLPTFDSELQRLYTEDPFKREILESFYPSAQALVDLNEEYREAVRDRNGCRTWYGITYSALPVISMLSDISREAVSPETLKNAVLWGGIGIVLTYMIEPKEKYVREGKKVVVGALHYHNLEVDRLSKEIQSSGKDVSIYLKILGLRDTKEMRKHYSPVWAAKEIMEFMDKERKEEEIIEAARANLAARGLLDNNNIVDFDESSNYPSQYNQE